MTTEDYKKEIRTLLRGLLCKGRTVAAARAFIMEQGYYIMVKPEPYYKWSAWIVILGEPHEDGGMRAMELKEQFDSEEESMLHAIVIQLRVMLTARQEAFKAIMEHKRKIKEVGS